MRIALLSDIHANIEALDAVLADIDAAGDAEAIYHLGDLVGYASNPHAVIDRLRTRGIAGIAGNYDSTVASAYKHCGCKSESPRQETLAHISFEYTRSVVDAEHRRYLGALPFSMDLRPLGGYTNGPRLILVHGTPTLNTLYWTEERPDAFCLRMAEEVRMRPGDVLAFGHTHKPWHRRVAGRHFINAGSVGRPKDGNWMAGYVRLTLGESPDPQVEFVRVPYDIESTIAGLRMAELPEEFAEFLRTGGGLG